MLNLLDISRQAYDGRGFEQIGQQFGLGPDQAKRAVEALLPAFSMAFQRIASDPAAFATLGSVIASGLYRPYFDGSALPKLDPLSPQAFSPLTTQFFGSDASAKRITDHAASFAEIGPDVMARMLPVVAATLVGGMSRYATLDGFADLLRHWSDAIKAAVAARQPQPAYDPWSAWSQLMTASMAGPPQPPPAQPAASTSYDAWLRGMQAFWITPAPPAKAEPKAATAPAQPNPALALARMFETGCDLQTKYVSALGRLIDESPKRA